MHLIALTSPGPDTAIVIRQVSLYGRKEGFKTAVGIGIGIYALFAVLGIALIIKTNIFIFNGLKYGSLRFWKNFFNYYFYE